MSEAWICPICIPAELQIFVRISEPYSNLKVTASLSEDPGYRFQLGLIYY